MCGKRLWTQHLVIWERIFEIHSALKFGYILEQYSFPNSSSFLITSTMISRRLSKLASKIDLQLVTHGHTYREEGKLWAKWSYRTAELLLTMGYFFGSIPVYWDRPENKMEMITSRFDKIRWIFTIALNFLIQVALVVVFFVDMYIYGDPMKFILKHASFTRGIYAFISAFTMLFHIHTAWKYKEFVCFINAGARFYEAFQSKLELEYIIYFQLSIIYYINETIVAYLFR